jgi:membrane protease subunit HflC
MNQGRVIVLALVAVIVVLVGSSSFYTVNPKEWALVMRFGKVLKTNDQTGLHFKIPMIDRVTYYDKRILNLDMEPQRYLTVGKKALVVDSYVKWHIVDPLEFYQAVDGSEDSVGVRLTQLVNGGLRNEFGKRKLLEIVSGDRQQIVDDLRASLEKAAQQYGVEVVDVRLQRIDLPEKVSVSVYRRMEANRSRIAKQYRAQGAEAAQTIRADANRQAEIIRANAYQKAQAIRGEGDAKATLIYSRALRINPDFYKLYRSLEAYRKSFKNKDDVLILDPSSEFFRYLKNPNSR